MLTKDTIQSHYVYVPSDGRTGGTTRVRRIHEI